MTTRRERFEIRIEAPPEQVWEMLTTANGLTSWFGTHANIDLRIGGERVVGWGDQQELIGQISRIEELRRIVVSYLADEQEIGAEEWLIESDGTTTRLTMLHSMPDDGIEDWEGFYGDIRRGWRLFMASMKHALESALQPGRVVNCAYSSVNGRESSWQRLQDKLDSSQDLLTGMRPLVVDPPHSLFLASADRTLILDHEGSGQDLVLFVQAAIHDGPDEWPGEALQRFT